MISAARKLGVSAIVFKRQSAIDWAIRRIARGTPCWSATDHWSRSHRRFRKCCGPHGGGLAVLCCMHPAAPREASGRMSAPFFRSANAACVSKYRTAPPRYPEWGQGCADCADRNRAGPQAAAQAADGSREYRRAPEVPAGYRGFRSASPLHCRWACPS